MKKKIELKFPPPLLPGDTIGVAAPAGAFDRIKFETGLTVLEKMGFRVFVPEEIFRTDGYLAGSDAHRAAVLNSMFANPEIKAVFCARGGYGSLRVLPLLDYALIQKNPKIVVGFSDISALLWAFVEKCGLVCFHGPVITSLADTVGETLDGLTGILTGQGVDPLMDKESQVLFHGTAKGRAAGGNLTTLCHLVGTGFTPDFGGKILFIEDVGEAPYRVDRMLTHMKLAGCFKNISGVVLGSFDGCGEYGQIKQIAADIFKEFGIPVVAGGRFGHGNINITFPMGGEVRLDTAGMGLSFSGYGMVRRRGA